MIEHFISFNAPCLSVQDGRIAIISTIDRYIERGRSLSGRQNSKENAFIWSDFDAGAIFHGYFIATFY